jgi:guanylate kinase
MDDLLLLIVCSPSGAGKTTLTRHLLTTMPELTFSVSHTTRAPREGEVDGQHYHFVDRETFEAMVRRREFFEWAEVHGNCYGTCLDELRQAADDGFAGLVLDIDTQGARQVRARRPHARSVFILPPSMAELRRRLEGRGTESAEVVGRRMAKASEELAHYGFFDYLLVNDDLAEAKTTIVAIARAELVRRVRTAHLAEALLQRATC